MERPYSHSRPPTFSSKNKPPPLFSSSSSSSSFNNNNNNGGFFTTSYDDVFGGPPKFASSSSLAPRAEDYSEIFGGLRSSSSSSFRSSSSIPVLDLPAIPDDIHSAAVFFDYSEVFGGFNAVDFAVPFDQLFRPCHGSFCDADADADASSDEAWTPVGSESLSDDSDPFAFSEKSQCFSSENSHQPSQSKQFNVSYHKVNPGTSTYTPNTMHVAQLNDEPGYTCLVDEATCLREMGKEEVSPDVEGIAISMPSLSDLSQKHTSKAMSHSSYDATGTDLKPYNNERRSSKTTNAGVSHMNFAFASVSDINLVTEPSHLPPPSRTPPTVVDRDGGSGEPNSGLAASEKCGLEATVDGNLPSFFDMEVDASSSAAASAAAMKDVMDKAQAKFKAAKESRDRKDRVQNNGKLHPETDLNGEENIQGAHADCLYGDIKSHATTDRGSSKVKNSTKARHAKNASLDLLDILAGEHPFSEPGKPAATKQGKKSSLPLDNTLTDATGQWKEARQYYEFVNNDNTLLASQPPSNNGDAKAANTQQGGGDDNSDSAGEVCITAENRRRLKATKAVSRQGYYEKMVKVAQEVHDNVIYGHVEPDRRMKGLSQGNPGQQKPQLVNEPEKNEIPLYKDQKLEVENQGEAIWQGEARMGSKNLLEREECRKQSEACYSEQVDRNAEGPHESMFKLASEIRDGETVVRKRHEQRVEESCERQRTERVAASEIRDAETVVKKGHEQRVEESCERQRTERVADVPKQKRNKETRQVVEKRSKEPSEGALTGDRMQTTETGKKDNTKDLKQMKAADQRLKKAFEDVSCMERLQRACESVETITSQNLQQKIDGCEKDPEEAVDAQGSMKTIENCVEFEKCQKDKEAQEDVRDRQRLYEASNLMVDNKDSEEGQKQNETKEKLQKNTGLEHESLQAHEPEKSTNIDENTGDKEDQKGAYRSHTKIKVEDEDHECDRSPDIELPTEDKHLKSSGEANLHEDDVELNMSCEFEKPPKIAAIITEMTAEKDFCETGTTPLEEKSNFKAVKATDVFIDENQIDPIDASVGPSDMDEIEERYVQASGEFDLKEDNTKMVSVCNGNEQTLKQEKKKTAQLNSDPNLVKDHNVDIGVKRNVMGEGQFPVDHADKVRPTLAEGTNGFTEHTKKEEVVHSVLPEGKACFQNISHLPNLGQSIERKGKTIGRSCSSEDKDEDKERDLETERLRKLEEERERLREREKDRMAVELAVREARDRAYADARDRAERAALERATDEARQRAMAEARERLEKACAEARERSQADKERSVADKTSEARLRAERAAVERANAEARQRAIEKAKADRATFEARERMQRSVSEKYTSERDVIMRQSSFPTTSERFEAAYGEPAQRCKARLERHRRTVERVANALAEKNMRDLHAQREQAERTRFAETLDADIRRWSSGKEGNLRALLSTLQYILGPDSGWQPIPLTEVITAAAVKKAYRKATLCVHPDKLQQRSATIQQKYICEKVFDLLKEAWNRFNSEEK
ncbi:Auxilin-like protein 1 [Bienertia sinuspersici]